MNEHLNHRHPKGAKECDRLQPKGNGIDKATIAASEILVFLNWSIDV